MADMVEIFIAHSSKDKWLIGPISENLKLIDVYPYLAELDAPNPVSLYDKLKAEIQKSTAVFLILTRNVMNIPDTRDIVNWEISTAKSLNKLVYVFREQDVEVPMLIEQLYVYFTFDPLDQGSLNDTLSQIVTIASRLKEMDDKGRAAATMIALILGVFFLAAVLGHE